jgi:hypothetical protein
MIEHAIVPLGAPETNWNELVRFVERSGQPVWLEADGEIHGVLLPTTQARRLMGQWTRDHDQESVASQARAVAEER